MDIEVKNKRNKKIFKSVKKAQKRLNIKQKKRRWFYLEFYSFNLPYSDMVKAEHKCNFSEAYGVNFSMNMVDDLFYRELFNLEADIL